MALIKCSECGKEVSENAASCPNCGNPISDKQGTVNDENLNDKLYCPHCGSSNLTANKKGFGVGKAVGGVILTGGIGLLAGTIGSSKVVVTCLKCGEKTEAGKLLNKPLHPQNNHLDEDLKIIIRNEGLIPAIKYYKEIAGVDLTNAKSYVDELVSKNNITPSKGRGCAGIVIIFILLTSSLIAII